MGKRYFVYARKSTDDGHRQQRSIEDQLAEVKALIERDGLEVVEVLTEKQSAKHPGRPIFNSMLQRIERGEANGIIAWHPDRLARNALDAGRVIHLLDTAKIADLRFVTFRFEPNAQGKFMLMVMFGQSKYYVDNLSENIRRGMKHKLRRGGWPSGAPIGYLNDRVARQIIPHPVNGPIIRQLFELYATGKYSVRFLHRKILEMGLTAGLRGRPIALAKVHYALQNPFYCGVMRYSGELYDGAYEPLVTQDLFERCQRVRKQIGRAAYNKRFKQFAFRKLFTCGECGCMISMETQKGHRYLRCTKKKGACHQKFLRADRATQQINEMIETCSMHPRTADRLLAKMETLAATEKAESQVEQAKLREEMRLCDERLARVILAYTANDLSLEEFRGVKNQLVTENRSRAYRLAALAAGKSLSWLEPMRRFVKASAEGTSVARSEDEREKAEFVKNLGSNLTLRDQRLSWDRRGVWQLVETSEFVWLKSVACLGEERSEREREEEDEGEWRGGDSNS